MSLHVQHMQVAVGDPYHRPPSGFGYWVAAGYERYSTWIFSTHSQRTHYEEAVTRYCTLEAIHEPDPFTLAALGALLVEGGEAQEFAQDELRRYALGRSAQDALTTIATTITAGLQP